MQRGIQTQQDKRTYITVSNGKFIKRVSEPTKESISREFEKGINAGSIVHEEHFKSFVGALIGINVEEGKFGKQWEFKIDVSPNENQLELFILKLNYSSGYAVDVLKRLPNVDFSKDIIFSGYNFVPEGKIKAKIGLSLGQYDANGKSAKVFNAYFGDNARTLPDWEEVEDPQTGKMVWSTLKQMKKLQEMVDTEIMPNFGEEVEATAAPEPEPSKPIKAKKAAKPKQEEAPEEVGNEEDVPF